MNSKQLNRCLGLSLEDIQRYLLEHKWRPKAYPNKKISLFVSPHDNEGNQLEIYLPKSRHYDGYEVRVSDALRILSLYRDVDLDTVIDDISLTDYDIFQMRIMDVGSVGVISLSVAVNDVNALKKLFMYSACGEENSLPYFDKPLAVGFHHADVCQFGHTFEGSFGFTINSPIPVPGVTQMALVDQKIEPPFERRVLERIARSLSLIALSAAQKTPEILVEQFDIALNAKMCEAILDMSQARHAIGFHVSWSHKIAVSEDIVDNDWLLETDSFEVLQYAADELQKIEPSKTTIVGNIVTLHSTNNPMSSEDFYRKAIVKYDYDGRTLNVKLDLDRQGYMIAYEAHGKGLPIRVTGTLFGKGNTWKMADIEEISIALK